MQRGRWVGTTYNTRSFVSQNHSTESFPPHPRVLKLQRTAHSHETPGDILSWVDFKPDIDFNCNAFAKTSDDFKTEAGRYVKAKATRRVLHAIGQKVVWQEGAGSQDHTYVQDTSNDYPVIVGEVIGDVIGPDEGAEGCGLSMIGREYAGEGEDMETGVIPDVAAEVDGFPSRPA